MTETDFPAIDGVHLDSLRQALVLLGCSVPENLGHLGADLSLHINRLTREVIAQSARDPKVKVGDEAAVDPDYFWMPMESAPRGVKIQLLGRYGVATHGVATRDSFFVGWAPMPKTPEWMKGLMR